MPVYAENNATQTLYETNSFNDGSFVFQSLPAGTYTLSVSGALVTAGGTATVNSGQALTGVPLTLGPGSAISGQVFSQATNQPIAGATIEAFNVAGGGAEFDATTNAQGNYDLQGLPPGVYDLVVEAGGFARSVAKAVDVTAGNAVQSFTFASEAAIGGEISLAPGGAGMGTLAVLAVPSGSTDPNQNYGTTSTVNSFSLNGLPAGTYDVTLSLPGYITQTVSSVTLAAGQTVDLGTITLAPASEVNGTVTSTDPNHPTAEMLVTAVQGTTVVGSAIADESGNFQIKTAAGNLYADTPQRARQRLFLAHGHGGHRPDRQRRSNQSAAQNVHRRDGHQQFDLGPAFRHYRLFVGTRRHDLERHDRCRRRLPIRRPGHRQLRGLLGTGGTAGLAGTSRSPNSAGQPSRRTCNCPTRLPSAAPSPTASGSRSPAER